MEECWLSPEDKNRSLLLVGRSGNGKSATGNSIIGSNVFDEMPSSACVTNYNGRILTVIDTPGSFDISDESEIFGMDTGIHDGIHAILVVLSLRTRFSVEDSSVIESLTRFFGAKLIDYMIVVFTHGDSLEGLPIDCYLARNCFKRLAKTLEMCGNRFVVFDNVTRDTVKKCRQRDELLRLVDEVVANNGGIPYTHGLFVEQKESQWEMSDQDTEVDSSEMAENWSTFNKIYYEDQLLEMELKHREMTLKLEKQLEDEHVARMQAEADAQMKSNEEISNVRQDLKRSQGSKLRKTKKLLNKKIQEKKDEENQKKNNCAISFITFAIDQIESKLRETTLSLENQLVDKFARMLAEDKAQEAQRKSNDEIRKLREDMERAQRYTEDTFKKIQLRMGEENQKKDNRDISEITSTIERQIDSRLRERVLELEKMLADEQVARLQAEAKTQEVERKSKDEVSKLWECLNKARGDSSFARMEAVFKTQEVEKKSKEISKLRECLKRAQRDVEELRKNRSLSDKIETSASGAELSISTSCLKPGLNELPTNASVITSFPTVAALPSEEINRNAKNVVSTISPGFGTEISPTPKANPFGVTYTTRSFPSPQVLQPTSANFSGGVSSRIPNQAGFGQLSPIGGGFTSEFAKAPSGGGFASFGTGGGGGASSEGSGGFGGFSNQGAFGGGSGPSSQLFTMDVKSGVSGRLRDV